MPTTRSAGRRGRLPVKPPAERLAIHYLSGYLSTPLPPPAYPVDVTGGITEWSMLGNGPDPTLPEYPQGLLDCPFAGRQHSRMAKAAAAGIQEQWETTEALAAEYLAYDNGQDKGANIADVLLYWYQAGKILAFAPLNHTNPAEVDAAMAAFHGAYVGVNLTGDADPLFASHQPWTTANGEQPNPHDSHCMVKVTADGSQFDGWVTWGLVQQSTLAWTQACLEEAWVIITEEDAEAPSLDVAQLRHDIDALHGSGGS
jgi:hypothetical protein